MTRAKLLYAALLLVLVVFYVLYIGKLSLELLLFGLGFPLVIWLGLTLLQRTVRMQLSHSKEPILKGNVFQWVLQITNESIVSVSEAQLSLEYTNSMTGEVTPLTLTIPILARNSQRIRLSFHTVTCGVMQIRITGLVMYDALRLFKKKVRLDLQDSVLVMPTSDVLVPEEWPPVPTAETDNAEYSKVKSGDDPSEIFDLHVYREGDLISRIHWKLSSKLDTLMVKEYSLPLSSGCLLVTDYRLSGEQPAAALQVDTALSALYSVMTTLPEQDIDFAMTSYRAETGMTVSELYDDLADAAFWLREILKTTPVPESGHARMLQAMQDFLDTSHHYERVLIFTPQLDDALTEVLCAAPCPERFTVFTAVSSGEIHLEDDLSQPFRVVPVMHQNPEQAAVHFAPAVEQVTAEGGDEA